MAVAEQWLSAALGADRITALISPEDAGQVGADAQTIIGALLGRDWRIVHVAGHGALPEKIGPAPKKAGDPPQQDGDPRGVVLSDGAFLGPREVRSMRRVPELVFVNCCHLAARNAAQLLTQDGTDNVALPDRPRFAAGVAEELIKIGVRCVIAAGWAVDDGAAGAFATRFYDALLRGRRFIDAVAEARQDAWEMGGDTWAAYQCYGDPDWTFRRRRRPMRSDLTLHSRANSRAWRPRRAWCWRSSRSRSRASSRGRRPRSSRPGFGTWKPNSRRVGATSAKSPKDSGAHGTKRATVAAAIKWYTRGLAANDGTASLKRVEQLGNLRARRGLGSGGTAERASLAMRARHARG